MRNQQFTRHTRATTRLAQRAVVVGMAALLMPAAHGQIQWQSGTGVAPHRMGSAELTAAVAALSARPDRQRVVVHFDSPIEEPERQELGANGLTLLGYLGSNAYFATLSPVINAPGVGTFPKLLKIEAIDRNWKLHPDLIAGRIHSWMIVPEKAVQGGQRSKGGAAPDPKVGLYVLFHPDADVQNVGKRAVELLGGLVRSDLWTIKALVVEVPLSQVPALADLDSVQFVDISMPQWDELNLETRAVTQANTLQAAPYGLDGTGITALIYDAGRMGTHVDTTGRLTIGTGDTSGVSGHATHVGGTVGGNGTGQIAQRGMAPGVALVSYGFQTAGPLMEGFLYNDPGDLQADYDRAINIHGADLANNSIGSNVESNGYNCALQGNYGVTNVLLDSIVRGSLGAPFRTVWAAGNERQGSRCNVEPNGGAQGFYSIAPPQAGKNQICVGALNSNDESVASFSSWGPCDDGRLKPDFCAPGCQNGGDGGTTSCSGGNGYSSLCGTSMASPATCGVSSLIMQDFRAQNPGDPDMLSSTLKVILAHTADDIDDAGPDFKTGYGSIRGQAAVDFVRTGYFTEGSVVQGERSSVVIIVNPGDPEMKVTLAWDDAPGMVNINPVLVNDLDLVVTSPSGVRHFPWTLNHLSPDTPPVRTQEDHLNNIEQVFVQNPEPGGWTVDIRGTTVPQGPQTFSVGGTPQLLTCSRAGLVQLNTGRYNCSATAQLKVIDCDLNTNNMVVETVTVLVSSGSEPAGEMITLTESAPAGAVFLADLPLSSTNAPGVLAVSNGDTVTLTYIDADDGMGGTNVVRTDTAAVDCVAPIVSSVMINDVMARSARVTFTTDEPSLGRVRFGTSCGNLTELAESDTPTTSHSVVLTGLVDATNYFYQVEATDDVGNAGIDNNGGSCYTFVTPVAPNFFSELFVADNDTDNLSVTFTPNGSLDFYAACVEAITALPTDPAGGIPVPLGDNGSSPVQLTGGQTFGFYGQTYPFIYVGSNGYVTFGAGDTTFTETFAAHFSRPRIAALFDDLNPGAGGTISYRQLADHFALTFLNVPERMTTNQNTFQIALYFDGRVRISWLGVAATDGIIGLSRGTGVDPAFAETNISNLGCQPSCRVDFNGDGAVTVADFLAFLNAFDAGAPSADFNLDGQINVSDFLSFLNAYSVGCP